MSDTDLELLARFTQHRAEDAFAEIVRRHVDLVHSAALRQVRSPQLAEEVAQATFVKLAQHARQLTPDTILAAWLYQVARREAIDAVRREARRQLREQIATEMNAINATADDWTRVEPLLDDAMQALDETDRAAVLLRHFENKSLREVGAALGTTEEAARKRVHRAIGRLREFFTNRGVTVDAGGLALVISANAVQAAPVALATKILTAAPLVGMAIPSTAAIAATKIITMTTLQKALVVATLVACVTPPLVIQHRARTSLREDNEALRQKVGQMAALAAENERLSHLVAEANAALATTREGTPMLRLPAPQMRAATQTAELSPEELESRRIAQLMDEMEPRRLTVEQVKPYLDQNRRNASSLLAAFRATGDAALLQEAMEKYPGDPHVNFAAVFKQDSTPEEHRQRLEAFKKSAPENALANYLSALDYFKTGQMDQAVREITAASGKAQFQDYTTDFLQDNDEVWRASDYPTAEAKVVASTSLELSHLAQLKQLAQETVTLADSYRQAGDAASAGLALQMGSNIGQHLSEMPGQPLITQLVGVAMERIALGAMDPASPYGDFGSTVQTRLDELVQQRSSIHDITQRFAAVRSAMSAQDWISYMDRLRLFGEVAAAQWAIAKHGQH